MDMNKENKKDVSYFVFESTTARLERIITRLWILLITIVFLLVMTNLAWIVYENQFEDVTTTVTQDVQQDSVSGSNTFVGGDYNGKTESETDSNN